MFELTFEQKPMGKNSGLKNFLPLGQSPPQLPHDRCSANQIPRGDGVMALNLYPSLGFLADIIDENSTEEDFVALWHQMIVAMKACEVDPVKVAISLPPKRDS